MARTAIVTGTSRGIGHAVALALAEEGADIAAVGPCPTTGPCSRPLRAI